jgi:hypothetical protein
MHGSKIKKKHIYGLKSSAESVTPEISSSSLPSHLIYLYSALLNCYCFHILFVDNCVRVFYTECLT